MTKRHGSLRPLPRLGPDAWEIRVGAGKDPATGRYRQASKVVHGSRRTATAALRELVAQIDAGELRRTEGTMAHLVDRWLAHAATRLSPSTMVRYRILAERHVIPALGERRVADLGPSDLDDLYGRLRREGLAPSTVRQVHAVCSSALKQAVKWRWLAASPADNASPPPLQRHDVSPPDPEAIAEVRERLAAMGDGARLVTFLDLLVLTGARRGEVCGLQWADVDLEQRTVLYARAIVEGSERSLHVRQTKTGVIRRVSVPPGLCEALAAHRATQEAEGKGRWRLRPTSFVFSDDGGVTPWRPGRVSLAWTRAAKAAGVKARLHDLRHAHATQLLAAGVDVRTVSGRLGHSNPNVTLTTYAHWLTAKDREAADIAGRVFGP